MYHRKVHKPPEELLYEKKLDIIHKDGKFGLRDTSQRVWLLLLKYRLIEQHPDSSHLWIQCNKTSLFGVFDTTLRDWLVPLQFDQIYHTQVLGYFKVVLQSQFGFYDSNNRKLYWENQLA